MNLLDLVRGETDVPLSRLLVMTIVAGLVNAMLLAVLNMASNNETVNALQVRYFFIFLVLLLVYIITKKIAMRESATLVERTITNIRMRISDKIRKADLLNIERIGIGELNARLTLDTDTISQSSQILINATQSLFMLFFCLCYLFIISGTALVITLVSIGFAVLIYLRNREALGRDIKASTEKDAEFFQTLDHLLQGYKELKVNKAKNDDLYDNHLHRTSKISQRLRIRVEHGFIENYMFSQTFFFFLLAVLIFILPVLSPTYSGMVVQVTAIILFIYGPLEQMVGSIPFYAKANVAIRNIFTLEDKLDSIVEDLQDAPLEELNLEKGIRFEGVTFHYKDREGRQGFGVGPFDLTVRHGETLFIIGGNGCGKSTFLKLLAGLYYPEKGQIYVDDRPIDEVGYLNYRNLYSIIFSDFHLFDRIYGHAEIDPEFIQKLLVIMELDKKTKFSRDRFTNIELSTGQRKRLALIVSYLDRKPICVFDEWAADQDPQFRKFFYENILPELKAQGKTVIAVTHDDKYFGAADRVIKMEYGKVIENGTFDL